MNLVILEDVVKELLGDDFKTVIVIKKDNWENTALAKMEDLGGDKHIVVTYQLDKNNKLVVDNFYVFIKYLCIHGDQFMDLAIQKLNDYGFDLYFEHKSDCLEPGFICKTFLRHENDRYLFKFEHLPKATMEETILDAFWHIMHTNYYYGLKYKQ